MRPLTFKVWTTVWVFIFAVAGLGALGKLLAKVTLAELADLGIGLGVLTLVIALVVIANARESRRGIWK